ncbi:ABC transporter permease [Paenibacillus sabinae]|uniref:Transport permease protein n=1 Tax=Paenibacillus sabinae T27 TaxID=1268072 RepID=X4ZQ56_9BACL|nr:ABC transporter permease [Paenibacillus sabinae]AHV99277.1 putative ABC transporter, membrane permease [Paenibacillus sabinae T27]
MNKASNYNSLMYQLTKREILSRYKGSYFGLLWYIIQPLLMLGVYTFVFSTVFKSRWGVVQTSNLEYSLILFAGITTYNIFADVVNRAATLIINNQNYVKKVVFPLSILSPVTLLSSLFFNGISYLILILGVLFIKGTIYWTVLFLPLVLLPIFFLSLGLSWFISSLGVFFRDMNQIINVLFTALMFLSPVFYPVSSVPKQMQVLYHYNPISYVIEDVRNVVLWGRLPDFALMVKGILISLIILVLGYLCFKKTKGGFADVL